MTISEFREGTLAMAVQYRYPTVTATGDFIVDASLKWLVDAVQDWHVYSNVRRHDPGWFHCSALGQSDERLIAAYRGEEGESHNAQMLRVFDNGSSRDRDWKRYLKSAGVTVKGAHKKVTFPKLRLRGECDAIVQYDGEKYIVEVKTINAFAYGNLQEPKADHRMQIECYMRGKRIPRGIVLYENKNTQTLKLFRVEQDDVLWASIVRRLRRLKDETDATT